MQEEQSSSCISSLFVSRSPVAHFLHFFPDFSLAVHAMHFCPGDKWGHVHPFVSESDIVLLSVDHVLCVSIHKRKYPIKRHFLFILSGCWELNPVYIHPMDAYCRYTTARSEGVYRSSKLLYMTECPGCKLCLQPAVGEYAGLLLFLYRYFTTQNGFAALHAKQKLPSIRKADFLKVGIFPYVVRRVIMTTEEPANASHL
jgi:hypothetical protein